MTATKDPHTHSHTPQPTYSPEFLDLNKAYYINTEDYDWVDTTDHLKGLEALFHKLRERKVRELVTRYQQRGPVLDAGCGTALNLRHLPPGSVGIDINPRNLPRARRWAPASHVLHGDLESLPFPSHTFSTIVCTEVLEHFPVATLPLAELVRVLRPTGTLIGSVPTESWIWRLRFLSSTCPHSEPFHKNFQRSELEELLQGLSLLKLERACFGMSWTFVAQKA